MASLKVTYDEKEDPCASQDNQALTKLYQENPKKCPPIPSRYRKITIAEKSGKENQVAGNIHGSATLGGNWCNIPAVASFGQDSHSERLNVYMLH